MRLPYRCEACGAVHMLEVDKYLSIHQDFTDTCPSYGTDANMRRIVMSERNLKRMGEL